MDVSSHALTIRYNEVPNNNSVDRAASVSSSKQQEDTG